MLIVCEFIIIKLGLEVVGFGRFLVKCKKWVCIVINKFFIMIFVFLFINFFFRE